MDTRRAEEADNRLVKSEGELIKKCHKNILQLEIIDAVTWIPSIFINSINYQ